MATAGMRHWKYSISVPLKSDLNPGQKVSLPSCYVNYDDCLPWYQHCRYLDTYTLSATECKGNIHSSRESLNHHVHSLEPRNSPEKDNSSIHTWAQSDITWTSIREQQLMVSLKPSSTNSHIHLIQCSTEFMRLLTVMTRCMSHYKGNSSWAWKYNMARKYWLLWSVFLQLG